MLKHLWQCLIISMVLSIGSTTTPIFADAPLPALTASSENFEDFPNWKIIEQSYYGVIAYSPDGNIIDSGSLDNTIRLWNARSGQIINTLKGHEFPIMTLAFSPDGNVIASGSYDKTIRLWSAKSGQIIKTIKELEHLGQLGLSYLDKISI